MCWHIKAQPTWDVSPEPILYWLLPASRVVTWALKTKSMSYILAVRFTEKPHGGSNWTCCRKVAVRRAWKLREENQLSSYVYATVFKSW